MHTPDPHPDLDHLTSVAKPINASFWSHGDGFSHHTPDFHQTHMAGTFHQLDVAGAETPLPSGSVDPILFDI